MRRFHSYGPVDPDIHYAVPRSELVEQCVRQLVGEQDKGGSFFTIWAPRQTGKTWLMRRARDEIRARYGDRFLVGTLSMQPVSLKPDAPPEAFLSQVPMLFERGMQRDIPAPRSWPAWGKLFRAEAGLFDRPLILLIDEFDRLPPAVIDQLVSQLRDLYLTREGSLLHGLALIGVRAVLGIESDRGSPFNVQRSLHVPNLTEDEVTDLFQQYQTESGQTIDPAVVRRLFEVTRGQPGLVGWFGELLTEKHNRARPEPITLAQWDVIYENACTIEPNNTILNLLKKARDPRCRDQVVELFRTSNVPFSFDREWCNYLYLNGVITYEAVTSKAGRPQKVCRFSCPFVQHRLFSAFADDMAALVEKVPPVNPRVDLTAPLVALDLPALLAHYREYLQRAKRAGQNPWAGHPRRADLHLREAVGHFHLYWWLTEACARLYLITPEFPTGNGKVDLHIQYEDRAGLIEVKSFTSQAELAAQKAQAARYAASRGLREATLALFVPSDDEDLIHELCRTDAIQIGAAEVRIHTVAVAAQ